MKESCQKRSDCAYSAPPGVSEGHEDKSKSCGGIQRGAGAGVGSKSAWLAPAVRQVSLRSLAPPFSSANGAMPLVCLGAAPSGPFFCRDSPPVPLGGESKEGGRSPPHCVVVGGGFLRGRGNRNTLPLKRAFAFFSHEGKEGRGTGAKPPIS